MYDSSLKKIKKRGKVKNWKLGSYYIILIKKKKEEKKKKENGNSFRRCKLGNPLSSHFQARYHINHRIFIGEDLRQAAIARLIENFIASLSSLS